MRTLLIPVLLLVLSGCTASPPPQSVSPEPDWKYGAMATAANPYAVDAAAQILRAGGHAVDAAIAAHAVLGLVEPQSSGLGGGGFMLVYDRRNGEVVGYDGRETAPAGARADMFMHGGESLPYLEAWQSGLSVGVPGMVALYARAHEDYGQLDLATVLAPAITLARDGFVVSPRLAGFLTRLRDYIRLDDNPDTAPYFYPGGKPLAAGDVRTNPAYAATLEALVREGPSAFYGGALAREMVAAARAEPLPGNLSLDDLAGYQVIRRDALCADVASDRVCMMPPPSSGVAQAEILGLYDRLAGPAGDEAERWSAFVSAQRLAYADRDHYVADPAFVDVPVRDLLDPRYLDARASQRSDPETAPQVGDPGAVLRNQPLLARHGPDTTRPLPGTSHLSIVDADGNAVSLTASVESVFGSSRWAGGFLLNNQLTDFARDPGSSKRPPANIVAPGKRPRSSMSPTMVFDEADNLRMVTGSPGGNSIVAYVAKTLVGVLRWNLSAQQAIDLPNVVARGRAVRVESDAAGGGDVAGVLAGRGFPVEASEGENSGLHVIVVTDQGLEGGADPRREGKVAAVRP